METDQQQQLKNIAFFLHGLEAGGAQKRTAQLASGIAALGVAVDIVLIDGSGPNRAELSPDVDVVELNSPWTRLPWIRSRRSRRVFAAVPALVRYLRRRRPDVWVAAANHTHFAALLAQRLARVQSSALVLRVSNALIEGRGMRSRRLRLRWARRLYRGADAIVAVAPGLRDELVRQIPELAERTSLVVNPVIDAAMQRHAEAAPDPAWRLTDDAALVVGVGRLVPQKDFATLLRAFAALRADRETRLLLLGEGPERAALERLSVALGVGERVVMPGFADNPYPALLRADVVVSSSRWEGLPGVLVEALALGRPVVGTDLPGTRAILGENSPHPVVAVGDADAMAAAISVQLSKPPAAEDGRRRAESFTVEAGSRAMLAALQEAYANHRRRGN